MINNEQLLAALNAVPPLEWEAVGKSMMKATLPDGHIIEISREGHATWLLFVGPQENEAPAAMTQVETAPVPAPSLVSTGNTFNTAMFGEALAPESTVWQFADDNTL